MANHDRPPGTDAVCFTAGPRGIPFAAGVIHAWLASDRNAPLVMAGISGGALSAAAMARSCKKRDEAKAAAPELSAPELEARRWVWFRQYLDAITNEPLKPIWDAIPDPDDYFADKPPVKDLSAEQLSPRIQRAEARSRRHYYRLVKLGLWLSGLRVSAGEIASCAVRWVRFKERYGWPYLQFILLAGRALFIAGKILLHLGLSPQFTVERFESVDLPKPRALFGWIWFLPVLLVADLSYWILRLGGGLVVWASQRAYLKPLLDTLQQQLNVRVPYADVLLEWFARYFLRDSWPVVPKLASLVGIAAVAVVVAMVIFHGATVRRLARQLGIHRSLFDSYPLRRKLFELFSEDGEEVSVGPGLLLVAAPCQKFEGEFGKQVWFEPEKTPVVEALLAALAIPGLFEAVRAQPGWIKGQKEDEPLELIDGALVRQNPLPALFRWLKKNGSAAGLFGDDPEDAAVHLVYGVPLRPAAEANRRESIDLVDAAKIGLDLARRRDSRMECRQTNFISELALLSNRQPAKPETSSRSLWTKSRRNAISFSPIILHPNAKNCWGW